MKTLKQFVLEYGGDDDQRAFKQAYNIIEKSEFPTPKDEDELNELLNSMNSTEVIDEINEKWDKYNKKYLSKKGPWKLLDDSNNNSNIQNTVIFGDNFAFAVRSEGFCLLLIDYKNAKFTNKGIITQIKYDYSKSLFGNIVLLMESKDFIWKYFMKEDNDYALSDHLDKKACDKLPDVEKIDPNKLK